MVKVNPDILPFGVVYQGSKVTRYYYSLDKLIYIKGSVYYDRQSDNSINRSN